MWHLTCQIIKPIKHGMTSGGLQCGQDIFEQVRWKWGRVGKFYQLLIPRFEARLPTSSRPWDPGTNMQGVPERVDCVQNVITHPLNEMYQKNPRDRGPT